MNIYPILKNEIKIGSRSIKIPIAIVIYNLCLSVVVISILYVKSSKSGWITGSQLNSMLQLFPVIGWVEVVGICIIVPVVTASSISGEVERQTFDMLLVTDQSTFSITFGKLVNALYLTFVFVISSMPIIAVSYMFGGFKLINILYFVVIVMSIAFLVGSIGIYFSASVKRSLIAVIFTFIMEISLIFLAVVFSFIDSIRFDSSMLYNLLENGYSLVLINPLLGIFEFLQNIYGGKTISTSFIIKYKGILPDIVLNNLIVYSILFNILIGLSLVIIASHKINPHYESVKQRRIRKKYKLNNGQWSYLDK